MARHLSFCLFLHCLFPSVTIAQSAEPAATVYSAEGRVERSPAARDEWRPAEIGAELAASEIVRTGAASRAGVLLDSGVLVRLSSESLLSLSGVESAGAVRLTEGRAYFLSRSEREFPRIETPIVSAAVRGTEFTVEVGADAAIITVLGGMVECSNEFGSVTLGRGEQSVTRAGSAPVKRLVADAAGVVQWGLHYPAVVSVSDFEPFAARASAEFRTGFEALRAGRIADAEAAFRGAGTERAFGRSLVAYRRGDLNSALSELTAVPAEADPFLAAYRGALHLAAGEPERAEAALARVPEESAAAPLARAARSVSLIARGTAAEAAPLLDGRALESQAERLACSYLEQSRFDLEAALRCAEDALARDPESAFLLARAGELHYALGRTAEAQELLERALALSPGEPLALTTAGFIELGRYRPRKAQELFEGAIAADPAAGLPRLGRGLAVIKQGELEAGRAELAKAAHLEPNVSLFRSYLGKAFFEEERESLAIEEYERAKELDPDDPTPYLYSAYYYLSTFRPIEALRQVEESIDRNDNRAVYRSRLLLDRDLAVRGSGLSEVFSTLNFRQAARVEAVKSLSRNFADYSAHQLLSSSYLSAGLNQAGLSEALLADLLSPVNFNLLFSSGSGGPGSNEYTALFDRPNERTLVTAIGRSEDERFDGGVEHVRQFERAGFLLRYAGAHGNGFRENDFDRGHALRARGAIQATPSDSFLLDASVSVNERGDTVIGADPNVNRPDDRVDLDDRLFRLGYHREFAYNSHFVAQLIYEDQETDGERSDALRGLEITAMLAGDTVGPAFATLLGEESVQRDADGLRFDAMYIHDAELVSLVLGGSVLDAESEEREMTVGGPDDLGIFESFNFNSRRTSDERAERGFLYTTWHLHEYLDFTAGVDYTHLTRPKTTIVPPFIDGERGQAEWNPKLGLTLYPSADTTVRAAWFQATGATSLSDVSRIEPSFVGGINQLFIENPGTQSEVAGVGLDHKIAKWTYAGIEGSRRQLRIPGVTVTDAFFVDLDESTFEQSIVEEDGATYADEYTVDGYVYQIFSSRIAGTADYNFTEREEQSFDTEVRTNRLRLGLTYYAENGMFYFGNGTWRKQDRFGIEEAGVEQEEDFWTFGLGLGYQFPKRHGAVFVAVRNIFDEDFRYIPTASDAQLFPDVGVAAGVVLSF